MPKLKASAEHIVNKEVARQLSPAGQQACIDISLGLNKVLAAYQVYFDEVNQMDIHLEDIKGYFEPAVWAKLNTNQRLTLEAAIQARARGFQGAMDHHMQYLLKNKQQVDTLGATGQAAIEARLRELQGLPLVLALPGTLGAAEQVMGKGVADGQ